jgi:hypothetical protein
MKIIASYWFTGFMSSFPIGIVLAEDEITGELKAYIGEGQGRSEENDACNILEYGSKFPLDAALILFKYEIKKEEE